MRGIEVGQDAGLRESVKEPKTPHEKVTGAPLNWASVKRIGPATQMSSSNTSSTSTYDDCTPLSRFEAAVPGYTLDQRGEKVDVVGAVHSGIPLIVRQRRGSGSPSGSQRSPAGSLALTVPERAVMLQREARSREHPVPVALHAKPDGQVPQVRPAHPGPGSGPHIRAEHAEEHVPVAWH